MVLGLCRAMEIMHVVVVNRGVLQSTGLKSVMLDANHFIVVKRETIDLEKAGATLVILNEVVREIDVLAVPDQRGCATLYGIGVTSKKAIGD